MSCVQNGLAPLPADSPAWVRELARGGRRPSPDGGTPVPAGMPSPPTLPAGGKVSWVGIYWWSDVPAPNVLATDAAGVLWVCVWSWRKGKWRAWRRNG